MRITIIEDDLNILKLHKLYFEKHEDIDLIGAFPSANEALTALSIDTPDVLLVDIDLADMSGVELIEKAKKISPPLEIMAYTGYEDKKTVLSVIKAGATGYILKGTPPGELVAALHSMLEGDVPMSPSVAKTFLSEFREKKVTRATPLSEREVQVLMEMEKGSSYKGIAEILFIRPHTVRTHMKNIYKKLKVRNKQEAILKARKASII